VEMELVLAIYKSAAEGSIVKLPLKIVQLWISKDGFSKYISRLLVKVIKSYKIENEL
jgi:hypothetical protein